LTNGFLPTATTTPLFLGAYTASYFLNPVASFTNGGTANTTINATDSFTRHEPSTDMPGTIGLVRWIPVKTGAFADSLYNSVDSTVVFDQMAAYAAYVATFNTSLTSYNTLKATYNTSLKTEKTRQADFFASSFSAATKIPTRPCPPDTLAAYAGVKMEWTALWATELALAAKTSPTMKGYYTYTDGTTTMTAAKSSNSGFL
jgi:hypothetical protein